MGEDEKKDYRLHLINTIDNAIDNGISVYDLTIANKKALRHNYINKQVVIDKIKDNNQILDETKDGDIRKRLYIENEILQELLKGEK